jgi:hypothetical protein
LIQESSGTFERLESEFPLLDKEVTSFIREEKVHWQQACRKVEEEIENYRVLDREEQIKFRMPEFPDPRLKILTGYTATSIDQLSDREGLFLTLECPRWKREGEREIFTINTGKLFVLRGCKGHFLGLDMRIEEGPIHPEPGYYTIGQNLLQEKGYYQIQEVLPCIFEIKDNIMGFFTRVDDLK